MQCPACEAEKEEAAKIGTKAIAMVIAEKWKLYCLSKKTHLRNCRVFLRKIEVPEHTSRSSSRAQCHVRKKCLPLTVVRNVTIKMNCSGLKAQQFMQRGDERSATDLETRGSPG